MEIIFFATVFLYLFTTAFNSNFVDYDFFARLIVGKTFFQTGDILKYDFLSYTKTHPWYDHEWGASVIFYFIHDNFGDIGLQVFKAGCLCLAIFFLVLIIKLRRKNLEPDKKFPIFNFLYFYFLLLPLSGLIYCLRCHHFTFVFFAIWLYVLEKARLEKNYKILWTLPPLMIIWSNIHGGCFMGLGITGIYIIGEFLNKKPIFPYILTLLTSFLFMLINPYGYKYVEFLIMATTMDRQNIIEWRSPFDKYFILHFLKLKFVIFSLIGIYIHKLIKSLKIAPLKKLWRNSDKTKLLLILCMLILTIKSMRFSTYFIFVIIPFCYDDFYSVFSKKLPDKINKAKEILLFAIICGCFIVNIFIKGVSYENFHNLFPLTEIEYLIENNVKGNIMVPFETGSYAAYKLYPNNFIMQDGRYEEVYPNETNNVYAKTITLGAHGWREMLDSIHHDIIITYKDTIFYKNLYKHPDYFRILESKTFALFIRKNVYYNIKQPAITPTTNPEFYKNTLWRTNINWLRN